VSKQAITSEILSFINYLPKIIYR